jgi:molybdenum cofactor cytidylyltransferase
MVLAAGMSTRMGFPKALIRIQGELLLCKVVKQALRSDLDMVVTVIGQDRGPIADALTQFVSDSRFRLAVNPTPERGMSSSMIVGLDSITPEPPGIMIILGDQPGVTAEVIDRLSAAWSAAPLLIVHPTVRGRRTTPVVFPNRYFGELRSVTGDKGGREVVERHADETIAVEMASCYDDDDIDTPEDAERLLGRAGCTIMELPPDRTDDPQ